MSWQDCECGRGRFDPENYSSCYECFQDRRSDYLSCIWCGKWHSPRFSSCFQCRRIADRDEASIMLRQLILARDDYKCARCGVGEGDPQYDPRVAAEVFATLQIDHIKPCAHGGTADEWNLQVLCGVCNREKGAQWFYGSEWWAMRTRLCRRYFFIAKSYFGDAERAKFMAEVTHFRETRDW